ncbi:MAG: TIGR03960 family B12-binding radical SAM protein, partial [Candidatus Omnitrophota bacterium]
KPLKEFDIVGFSLAYELTYTNVLNMLDLGGVPLRSSDRGDGDPVIIAGGPSAYNPEPLSDFIDAFVIGDAEEAMSELLDAYKKIRPSGGTGRPARRELLKALAKIEGVYVPSLYKVEYNEDGTIKSFLPAEEGVPAKVSKRIVRDFENAYYPIDQIVPYIQIVHDRIPIEILRGCKHACKFCLSGATYRPARERSKEKILELAKKTYESTGYEEISLLSLSSGDHSQIREIMEGMNKMFDNQAVSISVPSLRIHDILSNLPMLISQVKKSGLTFAPESGSECLRKSINKNIEIEDLYKAVKESFKAGWNRVKLYFMIGLPTEKDEDVLEIATLTERVSDLRRSVDGKNAHVAASINAFVPKAHTPFQWSVMESLESLKAKRDMLRKRVKSRMIELDFNYFERSFLEGVFSRGDRRLGSAIYEAWKAGAKFDSWKEYFNFNLWLEAFKAANVDPDFYLKRARPLDEIFAWDFIDTGVTKEALIKQLSI